jgi:ABC-type Fe3+ transport system permease subunit
VSEQTPSPRSASEPMAFSKDELWAGGSWAWLSFNVLLLLGMAILALWSEVASASHGSTGIGIATVVIVLFYTVVVGGAVSLGVMIIGLPGAWLVARGLRRVASVSSHVAVHGFLGAVLGVIVVAVYASAFGRGRVLETFWTPLLPIMVTLTATSVLFGWWMASRRARSELGHDGRRSPLGLDEAFDSDASLR